MKLSLRGLSQQEISKQLNCAPMTINRDLIKIRDKIVTEEINNKDITQLLAELITNAKYRARQYWFILLDKKTAKQQKLHALDGLRQEDSETIKRLQMVGILPKTTESNTFNQINVIQKLSFDEAIMKFIEERKNENKSQGQTPDVLENK